MKSLRGTFFLTNTPSIDEANEFESHVLDHQYSFHWRSWRVWQTRSWPPILPPIKKLKSLTDTFFITNTPSINEAEILTDTFVITNTPSVEEAVKLGRHVLITNTPSIEEAEEFDRHVLHHQYSLHWWNWRVWQTPSWSTILPPLKKLKCLTDTFFITNTPSFDEAEMFDRHVLDHQYCLHWWTWRVWQTRSSSPILPPLKKL